MGYPLMAEGEVGSFNPVNIVTCLLFDYKTAFNLQIVLHTLIAQIGFMFLAKELGLRNLTGLYLGFLFPFTPIILMNYMQISLVYPLFYIPVILYSLIKLLNNINLKNVTSLGIFISLQLLCSHLQITFITFIFLSLFTIIYLLLDRTNILTIIKTYIFFLFSYFLGFLLSSIQSIPAIEFLLNSNRSVGNYAQIYDQNLTFVNLLTMIWVNILGKPQDGSYPLLKIAQPWEGNFNIYTLPLIFLFIFIFLLIKNRIKSKIFISLTITSLIILLIALGKNSPISIIHSFPFFSSFRYPTRFVLVLILLLSLLSSYGFNYFINKLKHKNTVICFSVTIFICILIESLVFLKSFHIFKTSNEIFQKTELFDLINTKSNINRIFDPQTNRSFFNNIYIKEGYINNPNFNYDFLNSSYHPNINLIYNIPAVNNNIGPQLNRYDFVLSNIVDIKKTNKNEVYLTSQGINILRILSVRSIISIKKIKNNSLCLIKVIQNKAVTIYLYEITNSKERIQYYLKVEKGSTFQDFISLMNKDSNIDTVFIEDNYPKTINSDSFKVKNSYYINKDDDTYLSVVTKTNIQSILVLADTFFPGWHAYIDGKETKIYRANLMFRGIVLPKGEHIVEFKYIPESFYMGVGVSGMTLVGLIVVYILSLRGVKRRSNPVTDKCN